MSDPIDQKDNPPNLVGPRIISIAFNRNGEINILEISNDIQTWECISGDGVLGHSFNIRTPKIYQNFHVKDRGSDRRTKACSNPEINNLNLKC